MTGPAPTGRASPAAGVRAFTLIEVMAVMAILGILLLFVPPNLDSFGDSSRLAAAANSVSSFLTAAREVAIIDGHDTLVQYELAGDTKDRAKTGRMRMVVSARRRDTPHGLEPEGTRKSYLEREEEPPEEEWLETEWRTLPKGIQLKGYSEASGEWVRSNPGSAPIEIAFLADGTVRPAHAVRLVSLDVGSEDERTMTVRVNALTSAAEVVEGEADLPKGRDPSEFR